VSERRFDPIGSDGSTLPAGPTLLEEPGSRPDVVRPSGVLCRAVIADDDGPWRLLLRTLLERRGVEIVGEAWDAEGAIEVVRRTRPDLVVLDLHMPSLGGGGFNALATIRVEHPAIPIVVCSADDRHREAVIAHGACWTGKDGGPGELLGVIDAVLADESSECPGL
jgi:DNA-binding NarL/FixJ family response regulator